jgi:hypothetical protein
VPVDINGEEMNGKQSEQEVITQEMYIVTFAIGKRVKPFF